LTSFGLRPHVVYGPERDQGLTAAPSLAARAIAEGRTFEMNYTGVAGYDYVDDVALALVRGATEAPAGAHVVDLPSCPATPQTIRDILDNLVPGAGTRLAVSGPAIPSNEPPRRTLINQLFPEWEGISLRDGLSRTLEFYGWENNA
jgi:nucleoside-diphosphate-sugar epimerase